MKRVALLVLACTILFGCNGTKKYAAYECSDYMDKAKEALDGGYYEVQQARRATDWNNMRSHLKNAISYFDVAESLCKKAAEIASDYDSNVESYCEKAMKCASGASSYAYQAYNSADNSVANNATNRSQSLSSDGISELKKAEGYLWY